MKLLVNLICIKMKKKIESIKRAGIVGKNALGIPLPKIRALAKEIGKDHDIALKLWKSEIHEARLLASMVDDKKFVTEKQMEDWVNDFYSWDICDQVCLNLFDKTPFAYDKAIEWTSREKEYVKRAGFAMIAVLGVHDKKADDSKFIEFFPIIKKESTDERNFVKKAVNWALRQIGKRNLELNKHAIDCANEILKFDSKSAKWIANDAIRELSDEKILKRLSKKK